MQVATFPVLTSMGAYNPEDMAWEVASLGGVFCVYVALAGVVVATGVLVGGDVRLVRTLSRRDFRRVDPLSMRAIQIMTTLKGRTCSIVVFQSKPKQTQVVLWWACLFVCLVGVLCCYVTPRA